jgi:hypothetical protein
VFFRSEGGLLVAQFCHRQLPPRNVPFRQYLRKNPTAAGNQLVFDLFRLSAWSQGALETTQERGC